MPQIFWGFTLWGKTQKILWHTLLPHHEIRYFKELDRFTANVDRVKFY
jgi:hypothetical protein